MLAALVGSVKPCLRWSAVLPVAASLCLTAESQQFSHPSGDGESVRTALGLLQKGDEEAARKLMLESLRQNPGDEHVNALLGKIALNRQEYAQAVQYFRSSPNVVHANPLLTL